MKRWRLRRGMRRYTPGRISAPANNVRPDAAAEVQPWALARYREQLPAGIEVVQGRSSMQRARYAILVVITSIAASGTSSAAAIAPLPELIVANPYNVILAGVYS